MSAPFSRRADRRSPILRGPLTLLVAVACALLSLTLDAPAAHAAPPPLVVTIDGVSVSGNDRTDLLVITGSVTNPSTVPVYDVRAALWRSSERLTTVDDVQDAVADVRAPAGEVIRDVPSESYAVTAPTAALAPGASAPFTISAPIGAVGLKPDASYVVGAHVTGALAPSGAWVSALTGEGRSLATVPGTAAPAVVSVVELSSTPRLIRPGLLTDDGLADELAPTGRLGRLLALAARPGVSWAVDPALIAEVTTMTKGYSVVDGPTSSTPGAGQAVAVDWLTAFDQLPAASGVQSLYGRPDLVGAMASGSSAVLDRALAATKDAGSTLPVVAVAEQLSPAVLEQVAARGVPVVSAGAGVRYPWVTMGAAKVAGAFWLDTPVPSGIVPDNPGGRAAVALALTRAAGGQVRLLSSDADAGVDYLSSPTWIVRRTLHDLIGTQPTASADAPRPAFSPGSLTAEVTRRLDRLARNLTLYGSAAPASGIKTLVPALCAGAASVAWLDDPAGRASYIGYLEQRAGAVAIASGVALSATGTVTLGSDTAQFPATISNRLAEPIKVRVVGRSDNSARLSVEASDWVTVKPNDNETVLVRADASASGVVGVELHVETADGLAVSRPVRLNVEATNLGLVGWIIVGVSGVMLAVTTALRIRQVRRRRVGA